jgi:hypothetical protein
MRSILRISVTVILTSLVTIFIMSRYFQYTEAAAPPPPAGYTAFEEPPWSLPTVALVEPVPPERAPTLETAAPRPLHAHVNYDRLMADLQNVCESLEKFNAMLTDQIEQLRATPQPPTDPANISPLIP